MILDFTLRADRETIRISAPQVNLDVQIRNLVGILTGAANPQIVSLGDTPAEIAANAPGFWQKNRSQIEFVHPFDFTEKSAHSGQYEPLIAARIVQWYANNAFARMDRRGFKRMLLSPWVDRVDYRLDLNGFQTLPPATRQQFVRHLKKLLTAPRRVWINGEVVMGK